jgi:hypothetical protein
VGQTAVEPNASVDAFVVVQFLNKNIFTSKAVVLTVLLPRKMVRTANKLPAGIGRTDCDEMIPQTFKQSGWPYRSGNTVMFAVGLHVIFIT